MPETLQIEAGDLHLSGDRVLSGLLLPFGEAGRTTRGRVKVKAGAVAVPTDPDVVTYNLDHERNQPVGRATQLTTTPAGIMASFSVAKTPEGDLLLAEAVSNEPGKRNRLSAELADVVIRAGEIVSARLYGAAAVVAGAFPSAGILAADDGDLPPDTEVIEPPDEITVGDITYTRTPNTEENETMPEPTVEATDNATVDFSAAFGDFLKTQNENKDKGITPAQAFKAIASGNKNGDLHAALASVTHDDGDDDGDGVGEIAAAPAWLGEVYKKARKPRKFSTLITGDSLTHYKEVGYRVTGEPTVADYAGNLAEVPTGGMTVEAVDYKAERVAHGANVDRRYFDFNDSTAIQSFTEAQIRSYDKVMDAKALAFILASAETETAGDFVDGVNPGITGIVDGALALIDDDLTPTAAVVGRGLYRSILLTPKDKVAEYLTQAFGLEEGGLSGFRIVPSAASGLVGKVAVLDKSTLRLKELGGGAPVRVEAEYASNGGRTLAVFGYYSEQVLEEGGVRLVTPLTEAPEEV